jgi:hypothetical protein
MTSAGHGAAPALRWAARNSIVIAVPLRGQGNVYLRSRPSRNKTTFVFARFDVHKEQRRARIVCKALAGITAGL